MSAGATSIGEGLPDARGLRVLVVAVCAFPDLRGTAARVKLLAELAARCGAEVEIVAPAEGRPLPLALPVHRAARAGLRSSLAPGPTPGRLLLRDPLLAAATRRAARALRPHVIHAHHVEGVLVARAARARAGLVYDAHTCVAAELPSWLGAPRASGWLGGRIERRAALAADHVIAVCDGLGAELATRAGLASAALSIVPTPLDPLPPLPPRPRAARALPRVAYAGGLSRFQGLDLLREAFERHVWRARPEVELELLVPDAHEPLERAWPAAARTPRLRVRRAGSVARDLASLAEADLCAVPRSARGGLPQKIVNAMRLGVPLVACNGAWDGLDAGFARVVPAEPRAFGQAILALLASPSERARLASAARRESEVRFDPVVVARRLLAAYRAASRTSARSLKSSSGSSASSSTSSTISSV